MYLAYMGKVVVESMLNVCVCVTAAFVTESVCSYIDACTDCVQCVVKA